MDADFRNFHTLWCLLKLDVKDFSKNVYLYLLNANNFRLISYDGLIGTLSFMFCVSERSIYRAIDNLLSCGLLSFKEGNKYLLINDFR